MMKICTIYDAKAEAYMQPMFFQSAGQAVRSFSDVVNDKSHAIGQHPEDYTMFCVGEWDERSGKIEVLTAPVSLAHGLTLVLESGE